MVARTESLRSSPDSPSRADLSTALQRIADFEIEVATLKDALKLVTCERDLFEERWKALMGKLFAAKSEARGMQQQALVFNEAEALAVEAPVPKVEIAAHTRIKRGRKPLDPALPREVIRHELPEQARVCPEDGTVMTEIGVEASEQLDIVPAKVKVIRHERVKYACPCCRTKVQTAPGPKKLIPKGLFTENALAWVITAKYQDALPLNRQTVLLNRFGGDLTRQTLAHNVMRIGRAVQPIVNLLADTLRDADLVLGDETPLQVLNEKGRPAEAKSWLWVQMSGTGPPVRLFTYAPSRSAETARLLYADTHGALLTDGYEAYAQVAAAHGLTHLGCWAHARRKFVDAEKVLPKTVRNALPTQFLAAIGELYAVEQAAHALEPEERLALRQARSVPVMKRIEALLVEHLPNVLPKSLLGQALHYLQGQWLKLTRFVDDARYPIDNNACENALRPFVIGRKNWLFADSVAGAHASAHLYSLIETAKANGVEPYRYLAALFKALPCATTLDDYEALLPWRIKFLAA